MESPSRQPENAHAGFAEIVGAAHVRPATLEDAVAGVRPELVVEPGSAEELARALAFAGAAGLRVAPRGGGTKLGWGAPPGGLEAVLSMRRLSRVLEHAWSDMTATVEAGCTVAALQATLAGRGQRLALEPLWPESATVGGVLATNDSGPLRVRFGPPRNAVLGVTAALADGTLARSGGKVVKNVAGYDLPKLLTGSFGTLAVMVEVTLRVHPLPSAEGSATYVAADAGALDALLLRAADSTLVPARLQARARRGAPPELDANFEGFAVGAQLEQLAALAGAARPVETPAGAWRSTEALWEAPQPGLVARVGVLPARIGGLVAALDADPALRDWRLVAHADGAGHVRLEADDAGDLPACVGRLRTHAESAGGWLVVLYAPEGAGFDVWGPAGDALPLMRRVKERFDPNAVLNPGRFIGGI
jgi:glycolate oxidase FAD binding subunit